MSWRARLAERRGKDISKRPDGFTDETDETPFVSFVSDPDSRSENAAADPLRAHLLALALTMGIPRAVIDGLPVEELEATAEQVAFCEGRLDRNGDPLPHALLTFYLRELAERVSV
jgi:hypothetical protein